MAISFRRWATSWNLESRGLQRRKTFELPGWREFIQASPDESSCETRSRRSGPTFVGGALTGDTIHVFANHMMK